MCLAQNHFLLLALLIMYMTIVPSLILMLVLLSLYLTLSTFLFILFRAAASFLCACLVSVSIAVKQRINHPMSPKYQNLILLLRQKHFTMMTNTIEPYIQQPITSRVTNLQRRDDESAKARQHACVEERIACLCAVEYLQPGQRVTTGVDQHVQQADRFDALQQQLVTRHFRQVPQITQQALHEETRGIRHEIPLDCIYASTSYHGE